jgi:hypothetical protein
MIDLSLLDDRSFILLDLLIFIIFILMILIIIPSWNSLMDIYINF